MKGKGKISFNRRKQHTAKKQKTCTFEALERSCNKIIRRAHGPKLGIVDPKRHVGNSR